MPSLNQLTTTARILFRREWSSVACVVMAATAIVAAYNAYLSHEGLTGLIASSSIYNSGKTRQGHVTGTFELTNHSAMDIPILEFGINCRCTKVTASKMTVRPNETTTISCVWDTSGLRGQSTSVFVVVYSEGPGTEPRKLTLAVTGDIQPFFDYAPTQLVFQRGSAETKIVKVTPESHDVMVAIKKATCLNPAIKTVLKGTHEIEVSFQPSLWVDRAYNETEVRVATDCKFDSHFEIPVRVVDRSGAAMLQGHK